MTRISFIEGHLMENSQEGNYKSVNLYCCTNYWSQVKGQK